MKILKESDVIEMFNAVHNFEYDYSKFSYVNGWTKSILIHKQCGTEFMQSPKAHRYGQGCPKCGRTKCDEARKKSNKEDFVKESIKINGNIFDFSKFVFDGVTKNGEVLCKVCNKVFYQSASKLLKGIECIHCSYLKRGINKRSTLEHFIEKSRTVHGDLYDYSHVKYLSNKKPVLLKCKEHGFFYIRPDHHMFNKCGCKLCNLVGSSKAQVELFNAIKLVLNDCEMNDRKILEGKELDIVRSSIKRAIEFNGDYWHCNPKIYKSEFENRKGYSAEKIWAKDSNKIKLANELGYEILTIWESDWNSNKYNVIEQCIEFLRGPNDT